MQLRREGPEGGAGAAPGAAAPAGAMPSMPAGAPGTPGAPAAPGGGMDFAAMMAAMGQEDLQGLQGLQEGLQGLQGLQGAGMPGAPSMQPAPQPPLPPPPPLQAQATWAPVLGAGRAEFDGEGSARLGQLLAALGLPAGAASGLAAETKVRHCLCRVCSTAFVAETLPFLAARRSVRAASTSTSNRSGSRFASPPARWTAYLSTTMVPPPPAANPARACIQLLALTFH